LAGKGAGGAGGIWGFIRQSEVGQELEPSDEEEEEAAARQDGRKRDKQAAQQKKRKKRDDGGCGMWALLCLLATPCLFFVTTHLLSP
jgi:hypothetical protein